MDLERPAERFLPGSKSEFEASGSFPLLVPRYCGTEKFGMSAQTADERILSVGRQLTCHSPNHYPLLHELLQFFRRPRS